MAASSLAFHTSSGGHGRLHAATGPKGHLTRPPEPKGCAMNLAAFSPRKWRERQRERLGPDFADMGTAFGLDASFALEAMQRPEAPVPVSAAVAASVAAPQSTPAQATTTPPRAVRWWQRSTGL